MIQSTGVGGNITAVSEVSDDQKTTIFYAGSQAGIRLLDVRSRRLYIAEASRSLTVGENTLRRSVEQPSEERGEVTAKSKALTPEQQRIQEPEC